MDLADFSNLNDFEFAQALTRALRTVVLFAAVGAAICWFTLGWRSALLFLAGALIAATSILVWRHLMSAILARLQQGGTPRPAGPVVFWFFAHLLLSGCLLYVSLRRLDGSVYALVAGLGLAMIALLIEALRLLRLWTA